MSVMKLSVALERRVAQAARASAKRRGMSFSTWLTRAAENALEIEAGLVAVTEWEKAHGALSSEELARADAVLDRRHRR